MPVGTARIHAIPRESTWLSTERRKRPTALTAVSAERAARPPVAAPTTGSRALITPRIVAAPPREADAANLGAGQRLIEDPIVGEDGLVRPDGSRSRTGRRVSDGLCRAADAGRGMVVSEAAWRTPIRRGDGCPGDRPLSVRGGRRRCGD